MNKKCIFHVPYRLDLVGNAAPMIRPRKIISALKNIGYEVYVIEGYAAERKKKIKRVKKEIRNGVKYQFLYTESSTMPTLLTDPHHMPVHPFVDFSFFSFAKRHGIKIGLFYRDIYWKFNNYKKVLPVWKSFFAIKCYKYDIRKYRKLLSKMYLPDRRVYEYLKSDSLEEILDILPPGCDSAIWKGSKDGNKKIQKDILNIFYVGGLGEQYQLIELAAAVSEVENCRLTLCCRKDEWEKEKNNYGKYLRGNIDIVHRSGKELEDFYFRADICSLMFKPDIYREMAIPYKSFEYLAHGKPVFASQGTAIGDFVGKNDIGWVLDYGRNQIKKQLQELIDFPELIDEKRKSCLKVREQNTWEVRAKKIEEDLS